MIIVVCCLLLIGVGTAQEQNEIDEHNDLAITYRQKMTLDKVKLPQLCHEKVLHVHTFLILFKNISINFLNLQFKDRVAPSLPFAYMKEDLYLIRWLRGNKS